MVDVAQLVRALDCGSRGRRFEPDLPPNKQGRRAKAGRLFSCSRCMPACKRGQGKPSKIAEQSDGLVC